MLEDARRSQSLPLSRMTIRLRSIEVTEKAVGVGQLTLHLLDRLRREALDLQSEDRIGRNVADLECCGNS
ncbi:hypothetical protein [Microbacterium pygmaeum]|uniref:hypothetical protein n=1 Tax=Microbacterium pygmaeum TaxID=370764 RepID=UPI0012FCFE0C|nr:hypothetical protein [Microbacterium pygmaeum]